MDTQEVRLSLDNLESPRAKVSLEPALINRWLGTLEGKRVLFFNNGKMNADYGLYGDFYPTVAGVLQDLQATCQLLTYRVLSKYDEAVENQLVREVKNLNPDGVVIGICDAGATYRTNLLARRLIQEGFPCIMVCNDLGIRLVQTMAKSSTPNMPMVRVPARPSGITPEVWRAKGSEVASILQSGPAADDKTEETDPARYERVTIEGRLQSTTDDNLLAFHPGATHADFGEALFDRLSSDRLGDGLPVVVPTREKVARMLEVSGESPETVIARRVGPNFVDLTAKDLAVNAVMAGCTPQHFPIVLAAMNAMAQERYGLSWVTITTHPAGNMVLVSGPMAREVGVASGPGCLGPGFRANATIGRAITLTVINAIGAVPGKGSLSVLGSPAQYSYCFAENIDDSPWPALNEELLGKDATVVITHRVEGPRNVLEHVAKDPEVILETIASAATSLGSNNAYYPAELMVILNPEHAWLIADRGWSKTDVRRFLYEKVRIRREDLAGHGIVSGRPRWMDVLTEIPVVERPEDIWVVVAGGWGPQSMVALPWGWSRLCWKPVSVRGS